MSIRGSWDSEGRRGPEGLWLGIVGPPHRAAYLLKEVVPSGGKYWVHGGEQGCEGKEVCFGSRVDRDGASRVEIRGCWEGYPGGWARITPRGGAGVLSGARGRSLAGAVCAVQRVVV